MTWSIHVPAPLGLTQGFLGPVYQQDLDHAVLPPSWVLCLSAISPQLAIILSLLSEENPCLGVKTLGSAISSAVSLLPLFHPVLPFLTQSRVETAFP